MNITKRMMMTMAVALAALLLAGCTLAGMGFTDQQVAEIERRLDANAPEGMSMAVPGLGEIGLRKDAEHGWGLYASILGAALFYPIIGRRIRKATAAVVTAARATNDKS